MNKEAFDNLLRVMDTIKPDEFDIRTWDCGTTACVIGHCIRDNYFAKKGFSLRPHPNVAVIYTPVPYYDGYYNYDAIEALFDIDLFSANFLFSPSYYEIHNSPLIVRDRIMNFLKAYESV